MAELLVKVMFWFAASVAIFVGVAYLVINYGILKPLIDIDKNFPDAYEGLKSAYEDLQSGEKLSIEEIQMVEDIKRRYCFIKKLVIDKAYGFKLSIKVFGSKRLDTEKYADFIDKVGSDTEEIICVCNKILYLAKSSKLAE